MAVNLMNNLNAIVSNTLNDSIKMIDIDELHESSDNFFVVDRIEEFAYTILGQGGVKDNLVVRPIESGGYEIISGHRRQAAVRYLLNHGENVSRYLPCLVQNYSDEKTKMLDIILMNVSARRISDPELWESYKIVDEILHSQKTMGEKFGRVREQLSEILGVSPAQVGKMQNVEKYAIPEVKEAIKKGDISISTANEIAKLDAEKQKKLAEKNLSSVQNKDVKKQQKKVDTNINISAEKGKVDTSINTPTEKQKVDTNINAPTEKQKVDTNINTPAEKEKVDTNINTPTEKPKVDTNINIEHEFTDFIYENYYDIENILTSSIIYDNDEDEKIIEQLLKMLKDMKDKVRERIRNRI